MCSWGFCREHCCSSPKKLLGAELGKANLCASLGAGRPIPNARLHPDEFHGRLVSGWCPYGVGMMSRWCPSGVRMVLWVPGEGLLLEMGWISQLAEQSPRDAFNSCIHGVKSQNQEIWKEKKKTQRAKGIEYSAVQSRKGAGQGAGSSPGWFVWLRLFCSLCDCHWF